MSKFLRLTLATLFASVLASSVAVADMQGFTIGIIGSQSDFTTKGTEIDPGEPRETNTTQRSETADYGAIFGEFSSVGENGMSFALGIEYVPGSAELGSKSRTDTDAGDSADGDDDGTYTAKAEVENMFTVYVEPGYVINETFGIYAKGGISSMNVLSQESIAVGTDSSDYSNEQVFGGMYGVGVKYALPFGLIVKLEATEHVYQDFTLKSLTGNKNNIDADIDSTDLRIAIGYNF